VKADTPHPGAKRAKFARLAAAIVALVLAIGAAVAPAAAPPAAAASYGPGYDDGLGFLGAYSVNGVNMYCLEQQKASPLGSTSYAGLQQWPTASADNNARVNWAIATYGQSGDRRWTAAVNLFVWSLMEPTYNTHAPNYNGDTYFGARITNAVERNAVYGNLNTIRAGAASITAGSLTGSATGTFQVDQLNNYRGTLRVTLSPTNMTGTVTLTNGIFVATGTKTISGVTHNQLLQVEGVPTPDGEPYKIRATGTFSGPVRYGARIAVYSTPGQQNLAYIGDRGAPTATLNAVDPLFRFSDFVPVLTSAVSDQVLQPGDSFCDTFNFAAALNPEAGSVVPWLQYDDGDYAPITASVTVYRTHAAPVQSATVPPWAVPFATFTITTTEADGPTIPYSYCTAPLDVGGYYVAVSTIRSADQRVGVQPFIPEDYEWSDGWGVPAESAVMMHPVRTEATPEAIVGELVKDTAFFPEFVPNLSWVSFEIYKRPDGSAAPLESDDPEAIDPAAVCTPATFHGAIGGNTPVSTGGGSLDSGSGYYFSTPGVYDWVVVINEGGPSGREVFRAPCGVVSERTIVRQLFQPELTSTVSDQILEPGDAFTDVFTFSANDTDAPEIGPWMQDFDGSYAAVSAEVTLYRTLSKPAPGGPIPADAEVVETFTITSSTTGGPSTPVEYSTGPLSEGGYYVAVSVIRAEDQPEDTRRYLPAEYEWTDGWGVVSETAVLMEPGTSIATPHAVAGLPASDTVHLPEFVPDGAWLEWDVYARPADAAEPLESDDPEAIDPAAVCTPETLYTSLEGGTVTDDVMTSPASFAFERAGVFDWVAVVRDGEGGAELWRASCGIVSERTVVDLVAVVTEAQASTTHDGPISDTAIINGTLLEGDELIFRAYEPTKDDAGEPVCAAANLLWESEPTALEAGVYEDERVQSAATTVGDTEVWWVEELTHADGTVEHTGECGLEAETSHRPAPPLASTGLIGAVWTAGAALACLVLGAALVLVWRSRRRELTNR